MEYKRLTKQNQEPKTIFCFSGSMEDFKIYKRLQELEDKIEQGTLKEIPENAVVLTREKYDKIISGTWVLDSYVYKKARKETVEKFAERAKEEAFTVFMGEPIIRGSKIDEICEEIIGG